MIAVYRPMCRQGLCVSGDRASVAIYLRRPWRSGIRLGGNRRGFCILAGLDGLYVRVGARKFGLGAKWRRLEGPTVKLPGPSDGGVKH